MPNPPKEASQNLQQAEVSYKETVIDGRSFKRSGRTIQFTNRVTPEYNLIIRQIAQQENRLLVEILEKALVAYCEKINWKGNINNIRDKYVDRERERESKFAKSAPK